MTACVLSYTQAPLTRCRADLGTNLPNDLMKQYYVQRASAGLVITEFTSIDNDAIMGDLTYTGPEGYTDYPTLTPN